MEKCLRQELNLGRGAYQTPQVDQTVRKRARAMTVRAIQLGAGQPQRSSTELLGGLEPPDQPVGVSVMILAAAIAASARGSVRRYPSPARRMTSWLMEMNPTRRYSASSRSPASLAD